jgi:hypothetical protein
MRDDAVVTQIVPERPRLAHSKGGLLERAFGLLSKTRYPQKQWKTLWRSHRPTPLTDRMVVHLQGFTGVVGLDVSGE